MNVEEEFARVLQDFQLEQDPFVALRRLKRLSAERAQNAVALIVEGGDENARRKSQLEHWELETKLWDLVDILYEFRYGSEAGELQTTPEYPFSSLRVKQRNYLLRHPEVMEIQLIIAWLQRNWSRHENCGFDNSSGNGLKWGDTRLELAQRFSFDNYIKDLDVDAPLRSRRSVHPSDESTDSAVFRRIYHLVLANRMSEAVRVADDTGNFGLGLILLGAVQDYFDPLLESRENNTSNDKLEANVVEFEATMPAGSLCSLKGSGLKHKLLWKRTTYELLQQSNLNRFERMIYAFLVGGDLTDNLEEADLNWEQYLYLHLQQMLCYRLEKFWISQTDDEDDVPCTLPPTFDSLMELLQTLPRVNAELGDQLKQAPRIIMTSVMIQRELELFTNAAHDDELPISSVRVLTHLAILRLALFANNPSSTGLLINSYVRRLKAQGMPELVPIYLLFVAEERDRREAYSTFLSNVTDENQRQMQMQISKQIETNWGTGNPLEKEEELMEISGRGEQFRNVLRRTVERVLEETAFHYDDVRRSGLLELQDDYDEVDYKVFRNVDWYSVNHMYADFIIAATIVIRRFLLCGKLAALKAFAGDKDFCKILKQFDRQHITSDEDPLSSGVREEFLQYAEFIDGLRLVDQFKQFRTQGHEQGSAEAIDRSIEKASKNLGSLISGWFVPGSVPSPVTEDLQVFAYFRSIYVPYLIFELLSIYVDARDKSWNYMEEAFSLITSVADCAQNDYLNCFLSCGRLSEFLGIIGEISALGLERGTRGVFA